VRTIDSFKIYMTEDSDMDFIRVYQQVTTGFIVPVSQQRPGDMKGSLSATSPLVQTVTSLNFVLRPTFDLSVDSYIILNMPNGIQFQGPSCTTINLAGGFSSGMSCSRVDSQITLFFPFDYPFTAKDSQLFMTVEEFLMPSSVQKVGTIQVLTYDMRDGNFVPLDMIEFKDLSTVSGKITKLGEVIPTSLITGMPDQSY